MCVYVCLCVCVCVCVCVCQEEHEEPDAGPKLPMVYVRLDPDNDWLCNTRTYQPEQSWVAQLEKSKDVVAQSQAVAGGLICL